LIFSALCSRPRLPLIKCSLPRIDFGSPLYLNHQFNIIFPVSSAKEWGAYLLRSWTQILRRSRPPSFPAWQSPFPFATTSEDPIPTFLSILLARHSFLKPHIAFLAPRGLFSFEAFAPCLILRSLFVCCTDVLPKGLRPNESVSPHPLE